MSSPRTGAVSSRWSRPPAASASASPSLAQHKPTAPASIWRRPIATDLWVLACGRSPIAALACQRRHGRHVVVEGVEVEDQGRRVDAPARAGLAEQTMVERQTGIHRLASGRVALPSQPELRRDATPNRAGGAASASWRCARYALRGRLALARRAGAFFGRPRPVRRAISERIST